MSKFTQHNQRSWYKKEIIRCLIEYGGLADAEAEERVLKSIFVDREEDLILEMPYFWAMEILHGSKNSNWTFDSDLWPPPKKEEFEDVYIAQLALWKAETIECMLEFGNISKVDAERLVNESQIFDNTDDIEWVKYESPSYYAEMILKSDAT